MDQGTGSHAVSQLFSSWFSCELVSIFASWTLVVSLETGICLAGGRLLCLCPSLAALSSNPQSNKTKSFCLTQLPDKFVCLLICSFKLQVWGYLHFTSLTTLQSSATDKVTLYPSSEFLKLPNGFKVNKHTQPPLLNK